VCGWLNKNLMNLIFPVTLVNFTDYMNDGEVLIELEQDKWLNFDWIKPWTKAWFEEYPERKEYLKSETFETFQKFWTIKWLMIVEWIKSKEELEKYYENIFKNISIEKSRSTILKLAESFNLIIRKQRYDLLNEILEWFW